MTQPTDTPAFGKLFIDEDGDLRLDGRGWRPVEYNENNLDPDISILPEIVRRWNLVGEAEAAALALVRQALATVIGERDAARAEAERLRTRAREISAHSDKMERDRDAALARVKELEAQISALTPPPDAELDALVNALRSGEQADMDGCMVRVSRQACEEAADIITALRARKGGAA